MMPGMVRRFFRGVLLPLLLILCPLTAQAAAPATSASLEEHALAAIVDLYRTRFDAGDDAAIDRLTACYRDHARPGAGLTPELEICIATDIAYAFFMNNLRGHAFGMEPAPEYTDYELTETRIDDALIHAGLDPSREVDEINRIASVAFRLALPALETVLNSRDDPR